MSHPLKRFLLLLLVVFAGYQSAAFAAGEAIRWVKVHSTQLNPHVKTAVSVTNFDREFYSCGEGCQMIKIIADESTYNGSLIISLRDSCSAASVTIDVPFTFEYEEIYTPLTTYNVDLGNTLGHQHHLKAVVTGDPDSVFGYDINLL